MTANPSRLPPKEHRALWTRFPERLVDLDLVRCTENAALAAWKWFGKGDKNRADEAASDAMKGMFGLIDARAVVQIGEGRKDNAPGIFTGEVLGSGRPGAIPMAVAVDPIDGTTLTAKGLPGAISVLAVATSEDPDIDPGTLFPSIPSFYMEKFAVGPAAVAAGLPPIDIDAPLRHNLDLIAKALGKRVQDLVAVVLDRPRHDTIICELREAGCGIRLISDGDVAAAIAPGLPDSGVDLYLGYGGSPEAVIAAAAIKCLGGEQFCRMWPRDDAERQDLAEHGVTQEEISRIWTVNEMARGEHIIFAATGISDSPMLRGIRYRGQHCITDSILMRARYKTVRRIEAYHNIHTKTVRLDSSKAEVSL